MLPSNDLKWVLHACAPHVFIKPLLPIDWTRFLKLIKIHKVLLLAYQNHSLMNCPEKYLSQWKAMVLEQRQYQLKQKFELLKVLRLFKERGIDVVLYKGFAASTMLYGNSGLKMSSDVDLLCPENQIERATEVLREAGFSPSLTFRRDYLHRMNRRFRNCDEFYKDDLKLELHWRLHHNKAWSKQVFEEFELIDLKIDGCAVKSLNLVDFFRYSLLHADQSAWMRLTWFLDCLKLFECVDFEPCTRRVRDALQVFLDIKNHFQLGYLPKNKRALLALDILNKNQGLPKQTMFYHYFIRLARKREAFDFLWRCVLTSPKDWAFLPLPKPIFFLYFILRPFLWLMRQYKKI